VIKNIFGAGFVITATFFSAIHESLWVASGVAISATIHWYVFMHFWQEIMKKPKNRILYALGLIFASFIVIGMSIWEFNRYCGTWFYFYEPWC
tara:strand:+ start:143 stop:421 length:279 start_codon:yes stop_codon:yes gene_type:complete